MKKANINYLDIEELACKITGLDYYLIDADTEIIENKLMDEFGCDIEQFTEIIRRLLPLTNVAESPLTNKSYQGFADKENEIWLIKMEL